MKTTLIILTIISFYLLGFWQGKEEQSRYVEMKNVRTTGDITGIQL